MSWRRRHDLPAPNPVRPGPGAEERLRSIRRRFRAVSARHDRASKRCTISAKIAALGAIVAFAVVCGLGLSQWSDSATLRHIASAPDPDLYFFLFPLAGFATFLAVIYECIQRFRRSPPQIWPLILPLARPQRDRSARPTEERSKQLIDFCRLCESDLPPKEQARQVREHFGVFGGGRRGPKRADS
jgi:hypothetical protein